MSVLVLGLSHKTAPLALLERLAVSAERLPKALASVLAGDHVTEAVVLSTCNRVEVYAHVTRYHGGMADLRNALAEWGGLAPEEFVEHTYDRYDEGAAGHLFAVASGLDSMVIGERQIHLQVRQALKAAEAEDSCGRVLKALFSRALRVGKRTRAETDLASGAASMVDLGLVAADEVLGGLEGATVLLVGAGKLAGMGATRLSTACGRILVANRTPERARRLADRVGGELLDLADLDRGLRAADLVVTTTGSPAPIVTADAVAAARGGRDGRPLVLLDLAVPRDVDPGAAGLDGVTVLDIDAVHRMASRSLTATEVVTARAASEGQARAVSEVAKARAIVAEETRRFVAWTRAVRVEPTIAALRARAEAVRRSETERLRPRLRDLDERQLRALDALTKGIVNTLLHTPTVRLKALADVRGAEGLPAALRELFDLPE